MVALLERIAKWQRWWQAQRIRTRDEIDRAEERRARARDEAFQEELARALARRGYWAGPGDDGTEEHPRLGHGEDPRVWLEMRW